MEKRIDNKKIVFADTVRMKPSDPAYWMLFDGHKSTPVVYSGKCYICNDPEFAQMGLPLCRKCPICGGHIAADDSVCDDCGFDDLACADREIDRGSEACLSCKFIGQPEGGGY